MFLIQVQAVTDNELVGYDNSQIVDLDWDFPAVRFVQ